jgi:6-pyruvoyl-tetrahydropterin synthase
MKNAELILKFMFRASHSLGGYEKPHFHYWTLEVAITGEIRNGMIVDMAKLRTQLQTLITPLEGKYLNDLNQFDSDGTPILAPAAQSAPTCETLGAHFAAKISTVLQTHFTPLNSTVRLAWISVAIHEEDKTEMGAVKQWV